MYDYIITLDQNAIGNDGAAAFAVALENHKSITEVGISAVITFIEFAENYIGDKGAEALVIAASKNDRMKYISLCNNFYYFQYITDAK